MWQCDGEAERAEASTRDAATDDHLRSGVNGQEGIRRLANELSGANCSSASEADALSSAIDDRRSQLPNIGAHEAGNCVAIGERLATDELTLEWATLRLRPLPALMWVKGFVPALMRAPAVDEWMCRLDHATEVAETCRVERQNALKDAWKAKGELRDWRQVSEVRESECKLLIEAMEARMLRAEKDATYARSEMHKARGAANAASMSAREADITVISAPRGIFEPPR